MRPTERLLQSHWGTGGAGGQSLRRLRGEGRRENMLSSISPFQQSDNQEITHTQ